MKVNCERRKKNKKFKSINKVGDGAVNVDDSVPNLQSHSPHVASSPPRDVIILPDQTARSARPTLPKPKYCQAHPFPLFTLSFLPLSLSKFSLQILARSFVLHRKALPKFIFILSCGSDYCNRARILNHRIHSSLRCDFGVRVSGGSRVSRMDQILFVVQFNEGFVVKRGKALGTC